MRRTRNAVYGQPYRGFESHPLRHVPLSALSRATLKYHARHRGIGLSSLAAILAANGQVWVSFGDARHVLLKSRWICPNRALGAALTDMALPDAVEPGGKLVVACLLRRGVAERKDGFGGRPPWSMELLLIRSLGPGPGGRSSKRLLFPMPCCAPAANSPMAFSCVMILEDEAFAYAAACSVCGACPGAVMRNHRA